MIVYTCVCEMCVIVCEWDDCVYCMKIQDNMFMIMMIMVLTVNMIMIMMFVYVCMSMLCHTVYDISMIFN